MNASRPYAPSYRSRSRAISLIAFLLTTPIAFADEATWSLKDFTAVKKVDVGTESRFLVASVSAPTFSGVKAGQRAGITVIGFTRGGRLNCYSHPERVIQDR